MERRELDSVPFTDLVGLRHSQPSEYGGKVEQEIRARHQDARDYLDRYDQLTAEQKEIARPCIIYKMAMGAVNRVVEKPLTLSPLATKVVKEYID